MPIRTRFSFLLLISLMTSLVILVGACKRAPMPEETGVATGIITTTESPAPQPGTAKPSETSEEIPYPLPTTSGGIPYPMLTTTAYFPEVSTTPYPDPLLTHTQSTTLIPEGSQTQAAITPSASAGLTSVPISPVPSSPTPLPGYPAPQLTPTNSSYPGPDLSPTNPSYPGPNTPTPRPTRTAPGGIAPTITGEGTQEFSPTITPQSGTPGPIPTERPPQLPVSPPPPGSAVTIWHSWGIQESVTLDSIIDSFNRLYPDVDFQTQFVPEDELFKKYHDAAYLGGGPSLVLGSADWGYHFAQDGLVLDLKEYTSSEFLATFNKAAIVSGNYQEQLISLPISQNGLVIFRNQLLMPDAASTFDELIRSSRLATRAGNVGSYLERGAYFSAANIFGLGGQLMDEQNNPAFDTPDGLEWLDLLQAFDEAGAVTFNTNRDLEMFKRGRVGIIIDGTWNIPTLTAAIGAENLAIDPWPEYGTGHMSGWVYVESIYVNSNTTGKDLSAALSFAGYLSDPNIQVRLAENGHIPSVITAQPRDELLQQAMNALSLGIPYPSGVDEALLSAYWSELNKVISDVFTQGIDPAEALQEASDRIAHFSQEQNTAP